MDTAIIDAWEHQRVGEDDDAYEGRINLGPPNDVTAAYENEDQRTADEGDGRGGGWWMQRWTRATQARTGV